MVVVASYEDALEYVREASAIDNAAYHGLNRVDTLSASARLRRMRDLGLLEMKGAGSRTYYLPGETFVASYRPLRMDSHQPGGDQHMRIVGDLRTIVGDPVFISQNSHQWVVTISQDSHHLPSDIPVALRERIPPVRSKPRRAVMRELIVDLCRWRPLSARDITLILQRGNQKVLVRDYLTPMVATGLLAYTIPAEDHHPDQRYVAANGDAAPAAGESATEAV